MNPLARFLIDRLKRPFKKEQEFFDCESALNELGYWLLVRPAGYPREKMPMTTTQQECEFVEEFEIYDINIKGQAIYEVYFDYKIAAYKELPT